VGIAEAANSTARVRRLRGRRVRGVRCLITVEVTEPMLHNLIRHGHLRLRGNGSTSREEIAEAIEAAICA
jgi:hypothetical protein